VSDEGGDGTACFATEERADEYREHDECDNSRSWRQMKSGRKGDMFSKMKQKLRVELAVLSEELCILASCFF